jgi:hypothetical protein
MNTLVIHPWDMSTMFLKPIYKHLPNLSVITGGINKDTLSNLIRIHDQVLFMGHGDGYGLLSMRSFLGSERIVDREVVDALRDKERVLYLWCHADQFVRRHDLSGAFSGMFISEMEEADYFGIKASKHDLNESNTTFATLLGESLKSNGSIMEAWGEVNEAYGWLAQNNPIASYNYKRLFINNPNKNLVV